MTHPERTADAPSAPITTMAAAVRAELDAIAARHIREALQVIAANTLEPTFTQSATGCTLPEPFAQLDAIALEGIRGRLMAALVLLENPPAAIEPRQLTNHEARARIASGERPLIAVAAPDGVTCATCEQPLSTHPVEIVTPAPAGQRADRRRICVQRPHRTAEESAR